MHVTYYSHLADGKWKFGCNKLNTSDRPVNCTTISSVGKLQQAFELSAVDTTMFVRGISSTYDIGLKLVGMLM